jgi:hypothetical protein
MRMGELKKSDGIEVRSTRRPGKKVHLPRISCILRHSNWFTPLKIMSRTLRIGAILILSLAVGLLGGAGIQEANAQRVAKYGADFLAGGAGARALGMGGAQIGLVDDVHGTYWNPAGLHWLDHPETGYMHAERFAGIVSLDNGSVAFPLDARSTVGIALFRSGVNDIKNTLDAWDVDRPKPNAEDHITTFSAVDYALYGSYARALSENLVVGGSAKIIRRSIGPFAEAWGYGMDIGMQYRLGALRLGANLQDAVPMLMSWSIHSEQFETAQASYEDFEIPEGGTEMVLPVLRLGGGYDLAITDNHRVLLGMDVDVAFDGYGAYAFSAGDLSFHPRLGAEYVFADLLALRAGVNRIGHSERYGWDIVPTVGTGFRIGNLSLDYAFGDFGGLVADLGRSHRISAQYRFAADRWARDNR